MYKQTLKVKEKSSVVNSVLSQFCDCRVNVHLISSPWAGNEPLLTYMGGRLQGDSNLKQIPGTE